MSAGRLNGIEIARTESVSRGARSPSYAACGHRLRFSEAKTTYGVIGIKCWVYKGEVMAKGDQPVAPPAPSGRRGSRGEEGEESDAQPALSAPEAKPEPIAAAKTASRNGKFRSAPGQAQGRSASSGRREKGCERCEGEGRREVGSEAENRGEEIQKAQGLGEERLHASDGTQTSCARSSRGDATGVCSAGRSGSIRRRRRLIGDDETLTAVIERLAV